MQILDTPYQTFGLFLVIGSIGYLIYIYSRTLQQNSYQLRISELRLKVLGERLGILRQERQNNKSEVSAWNGFRKFEISRKVFENNEICSVYLRPYDSKPLPSFLPGQYLTIEFEIPDPERPNELIKKVRCYSLSESAKKDYYRISVKKVLANPRDPESKPGLVSNYVHDKLEEGNIVNVRAAGGNFYLVTESKSPMVLIAGGIGITPVYSMLRALSENPSNREVWFFYGTRNKRERVFSEEILACKEVLPNLKVIFCCSNPDPDDVEDKDYDFKSRVNVDLLKQLLPSNNYHFYTCGPAIMMDDIRAGLMEWRVPSGHINDEAFLAAPKAINKKAPVAAKITFKKSGKTVSTEGGEASLLDLAEKEKINMPSGCRAGSCLTCMTVIREGEVDYGENSPSSQMESGCCLPCICTAKTDLVLDA
jgi:ferredoxin-NADP reductase